MRPAVPPEFRLKANTLTAYNGASRIGLSKGVHPICSEGKCRGKAVYTASSRGGTLCNTILSRLTSSLHLYHVSIPYFQKLVKHFYKNIEEKTEQLRLQLLCERTYLPTLSQEMLGKSEKIETFACSTSLK